MEFYKDGTVLLRKNEMDFTGSYSFLDATRIKLSLPNAQPSIFSVSVHANEMEVVDNKGGSSTYKHNTSTTVISKSPVKKVDAVTGIEYTEWIEEKVKK